MPETKWWDDSTVAVVTGGESQAQQQLASATSLHTCPPPSAHTTPPLLLLCHACNPPACLAANKGIGFEIARLLAEAGMTVVVTSRSPDLGEAALKKLSDLPSESTAAGVRPCRVPTARPQHLQLQRSCQQPAGTQLVMCWQHGWPA